MKYCWKKAVSTYFLCRLGVGAVLATMVFVTMVMYSPNNDAANLLIRPKKESTQKQKNDSDTRLLKKSRKEEQEKKSKQFAIHDLVTVTKTTELRRSRAFNNYNIIRQTTGNEIVTVQTIHGQWLYIQTKSDEFGWLLASTVKKAHARTVYGEDWTVRIGTNIGAIESCQYRLIQGNLAESVRVFFINQGLDDTTILLFRGEDFTTSYRCTTGAYGGEIFRFQRFQRQGKGIPEVVFTPTPGQPLADSCYSNEIIFNRFRRTLGWLSSRSCNQ